MTKERRKEKREKALSHRKILLTLFVSLLSISLLSYVPSNVFSQLSDYGPEIDHLYFKTVKSPDAQLTEFQAKTVDVVTDLTQPAYIDEYAKTGIITSTPAYHMCYFASNLRLSWMGPVTGEAPGSTLRKAIAYLLPKDTLIATLFRYVVIRLDTCVPPSLAMWYNPYVTKYDYSPTAAYNTLVMGGWTYDSGAGTWKYGTEYAGGTDYTVQILSPLYAVAPTTYTIVSTLVSEMNALKNPFTNDPTPIKATQVPMEFNQMMWEVFGLHNFEMYFACWTLDRFPDFLYRYFHSSQDWGANSPGIQNPTLDGYLETLMFSLDHTAKVQACKAAQQILSDYLPYIPMYSRVYFNAHQTDVGGVVPSYGVGIDHFWTFTNIWSLRASALYKTPLTQIQGKIFTWCLGEIVESLNPAQASTSYAWTCLGNMYDGLIGTDPFNARGLGEDIPWLASTWTYSGPLTMTTPHGANMVNGMYVEFTLDPAVVAGNVLWHDGNTLDANDIIFSWKYMWDNQLANYLTFYENLIDLNSPAANKVVLYWNVTSQWLLYKAAATATYFAPQVWGKIDTDDDGQNYLDNGDIEGDASIRAWQPENHARSELGAYPASSEFPWLTQVIGTGPFVFHDQTTERYHTSLFAFDVRSQNGVPDYTLHYWKTKAWINNTFAQFFYPFGDINLDGKVDIMDLALVGKAYGQIGPPGWIPEDFTGLYNVPDGSVDIMDLGRIGINYGKAREY